MARGGKRDGAGRKQDAVTVASKEVAKAFIASERQSPLEVMLEAMEYAMSQVRKTENALEKKIFYESAHAHAKDAAPYIHAKLANVEMQALDKNGNKADLSFEVKIVKVSEVTKP